MKSPTMRSQSMKHADIQLLLADYRDLRGAERREVEAHVAGCPACAARLAEYQAMDADLQGLRDPWPAPALRNGYRAAVKAGGAQADASRRATAPRPLYAVAASLAVVVLAFAAWAVLRPAPASGGRGSGIPAAKSAEAGAFVWQTDGVYGYEMLRPAGWAMADLGTLRSYVAPAGSPGGGSLELQVLNLKARPDAPDGTSGVPEGMRELRDRFDAAPDVAAWAKAAEELPRQNQPPIERIGEAPDAVIFQQWYDPTSRVQTVVFALMAKQGQPLIVALNAGAPYGDLETLRSSGLWDDFLAMIASIRPIPSDPNNVAPWAPTATPARPATATAATPAPTAAPVTPGTGAVDGQRDPEVTQVTVDVYSGRPNPAWPLTAEQTQALRTLLDALPEAACNPLELNLGFRGFVVELGQAPLLSNEYRLRVANRQVRWGDPWTPDGATLCMSDAEGQVAGFLLASGREQLGEGLAKLVETELTGPQPQTPTPTATSGAPGANTVTRMGTSLSLPEDWEECGMTERSWQFCKRGIPEGDNPVAPPVFYITEIPNGFMNEDASAYNWWSPEDLAKAFDTAVGEQFTMSQALKGYNTFTRLADTTVSGQPAAVVESERVWAMPAGTKDRRVLVRSGDAVFVLGGYYTSSEELQAFETAVASSALPAPPPVQTGATPTP